MQLRIWWHRRYNSFSSNTSHIPVKSIEEAIFALNVLALNEVDDNRISVNTGGLEVFEDNEWNEWYSEYDETIYEYEQRLAEESENA